MTSIEKPRRKPTTTAQFHCSDFDLRSRFPHWYQITHPPSPEEDFNARYAKEALELNIKYSPKLVLAQFGPLIKILIKKELVHGKKILEFGGASGLLSLYLQNLGANKITLLDTQENFVAKALERGVRDARLYDGKQLNLQDQYDIFIAHRVLEEPVMTEFHARSLMAQAKNSLAPGGCIIIGTQNGIILSDAIIKGSKLLLAKSYEFSNNNYVLQVNIYE